jgi:hypothetical protein
MRTFVQKAQPSQQTRRAKSTSSTLRLQRMIGNQAVHRLLEARRGANTDRFEREADRAAEQVTRMPGAAAATRERHGQGHQAMPRSGQPLLPRERSVFERHFGHDFGQVRLHADARSAEMADALSADAFTVGRDIYFGAGKLQPGTMASNRLLGHELTHVVQQSRTGLALQPKLTITGKAADVARTQALLNAGLSTFYYLSIDTKSGEVKMEPVRAAHTSSITGPEATTKALAERLWRVISDPKDVLMTVSAGTATLGGSYATGDFDIADLETYGVPGLIHEIEEQYQKQVKGLAFGSETTGAHSEAIKAESEVRGATRGAQKIVSKTVHADGTMDAVVEIPHTFADGTKKTMVMTITNNNIVSVTWK